MKKLVLMLLILLCSSPAFAQEKVEAKVVKVIDGDTINVLIDNKNESVRLLGIDCYETSANNRAYKQAYVEQITVEKVMELGRLAKFYVEKKVKPNDIVYLEFEKQKTDKYGRLLAYVYLKNGKMLNKMILDDKFAKLYIFETCEKKDQLTY